MKKRIVCLVASISLVTGTIVTAVLSRNKLEKAEASSYSVNKVPTTIDCNDTTPENIRQYYKNLNNYDDPAQLQGTNLLKNLKPILKNGQTYYSYPTSATTAVWQVYEIVDRDWKKSPATSISGYNPTTKIITGYTYGSSVTSDHGTNPYIHALYVNRNVENLTTAWDDHNQTQWGFNQEHIWAKSCGFENTSPSAGARGDLMHLWAGNGRVNGDTHSNYYYGYVDTTKSYNDAGTYASTLSGNKRGNSKTLGGSVTVFEPQDCDKGDIARACFYMAARYNYLSGSDSDGIDAGNPNLEIVNNVSTWRNSGYQSTTSETGKMGILQDLLEWNRLDPPDEWEIHRNNLCYNNFTNNRNPFIDFPEWAEYIWGKSEDGSYSSTSTGYVNLETDVINGFSGSVTPTPDADPETITMSEQGYSNQEVVAEINGDNCTITLDKGTNSITPKYFNTGSAIRLYSGNTMTITSSSNIVGINITFGTDDGSNEISTDVGTWNSPSWTGKSKSVTFTIGGTTGHRRIAAVEIIYETVAPTSISATVNKIFHVGETISKSDITVKDDLNKTITNFNFSNNNYQFTYDDADSGGALTSKTFENAITYDELSCSLTVQVQRDAYTAPNTSSSSFTGYQFESAEVATTYTENQNKTVNGIAFNISGYIYSHKLSLSKSKTNAAGSICNTSAFATGITNVSITGADLDIQLATNGSDWKDLSLCTTSTVNYYYFKAYKKDPTVSNYVNITSITVTLKGSETAISLANYVMFEDTEGQCTSKTDSAICIFGNMPTSAKSTFMTSDDYVISTARERLEAWLLNQGKQISQSGGDYVVTTKNSVTSYNQDNNHIYLIIAISGVISISVLGFYFLLKKKKNY